MTDSQRLLAEYANGSEPAFRELVSRYVNLVYSSAVRLVGGDTHLAEDVAQTVFVDLARAAQSLSREVMVGGWLHRHTCFVAAKVMRSERRRQFRETQAARMNALKDHTEANLADLKPFLDEAINRLGAEDRAAILLRFFEQSDFRSIGAALGTNEDAAQKRVTRALEKLQALLKKQGMVFSTAALGTVLAGEAVTAAPAGLAISISSMAIGSAAAGSGTSLLVLKLMAATKLKVGIIGAVVAACVVVPIVMEQQAKARLRGEDDFLRSQADQLSQLQTDNERLMSLAAGATLSRDQLSDLEKLRAEIGALRQQTNEVAALRSENRRLQSSLSKSKTPLQAREELVARMSYSKNWMVAFYQFAGKNGGEFPTRFDQAVSFLPDNARKQTDITTDQFEIVFQGQISRLSKPADIIVIREKESWVAPRSDDGRTKWARIYAFADGHIEIRHELENNFEAYEKEHTVPSPAGDK